MLFRSGGGEGGEEGAAATVVEAKPIDPTKDTRISGFLYGQDVDMSDGSMWYGKTSPWPSQIVKFSPGANPPETCRTEVFEPQKTADGKETMLLALPFMADALQGHMTRLAARIMGG